MNITLLPIDKGKVHNKNRITVDSYLFTIVTRDKRFVFYRPWETMEDLL